MLCINQITSARWHAGAQPQWAEGVHALPLACCEKKVHVSPFVSTCPPPFSTPLGYCFVVMYLAPGILPRALVDCRTPNTQLVNLRCPLPPPPLTKIPSVPHDGTCAVTRYCYVVRTLLPGGGFSSVAFLLMLAGRSRKSAVAMTIQPSTIISIMLKPPSPGVPWGPGAATDNTISSDKTFV